MIGDASSSNPPLPSTLLAPGFRFHPTDEELVSYYLKRKVSGRALRVDAIAEIDLYKLEPWDLPSRSRLRSRDVEWYFFSPLDRKYANRSRTNRATAEGYWKTTGKDRSVRHGSQIIGMKKTLVFHAGRAPRGERTNWVMHEYRLEDEELARAGVLQDAYVVCRIFQKNGSGPQNGAQYGAPFLEEEWEEDDDLDRVTEGPNDVPSNAAEYVQLDDFEQKQELANEHETPAPFGAESAGLDGSSLPQDPTILLDEILNDQSLIDGIEEYLNAPELHDSPTLTNVMGDNTGMEEQSHSPPGQNDGYVELNDIFDNVNTDFDCSENSIDCIFGASNDQISVNGVDEMINLPELGDIEFFFDATDETADPQELVQMRPPVEGDFNQQPDDGLNPVAGDYASGQPPEDNMEFYDAPSLDVPFAQDDLVHTNELLFSPAADLSGFDMVDDLLAYFDATDNNLHYATLNSSEKLDGAGSSTLAHSNFTPEVNGSSCSTYTATPQPPEANIERGASSAKLSEDVINARDVTGSEGWDKTNLTKRLVNMLGSISAPPAFAAEFPSGEGKSVGQISATTQSSSSIHVTAGMIRIHGLTLMGSAEHWTLQKSGDMGLQSGDVDFLLSYGITRNEIASKSVDFEPSTKMQGGGFSMVLRGGFYLFCLSTLILTISFKVGMCVYNR